MKHFALMYDYVADAATKRAPFRAGHLALAQAHAARGELVLGGAFADPIDGAILVFKGETPAVVEAFVRDDPYVQGGLVTRHRIREWTTVVGDLALNPVKAPA